VPFDEIKENNFDLSLSRYKGIEYEEIEYEAPEVIIEKIEGIEKQILVNLDELRDLLKNK